MNCEIENPIIGRTGRCMKEIALLKQSYLGFSVTPELIDGEVGLMKVTFGNILGLPELKGIEFTLLMQMLPEYPFKPPRMWLLSPIDFENPKINPNTGEYTDQSLKTNWSPAMMFHQIVCRFCRAMADPDDDDSHHSSYVSNQDSDVQKALRIHLSLRAQEVQQSMKLPDSYMAVINSQCLTHS